jgi:hypothetical protein
MMNGYNYDALTNTLTISESFAKKASKVGSPEYCIILKLRRDYPDLTIQKAEKKEGKKGLTYAQMEEFISMHRNAAELKAAFEKVKKLARIQPMPYKYVKTWFDNRFPYFSDQPTFDADGFVVDSANYANAAEMLREVETAMEIERGNLIPAEAKVA